jgi:integrase
MSQSKSLIKLLLLAILTMAYAVTAFSQPSTKNNSLAIERADSLMRTVRDNSYPELRDADIRVRLFNSESDYFRTRFSFTRFVFGLKMRFFIEVNAKVFDLQAPQEGLRAIIAHELSHVLFMRQRNRIELLSLVRLASKNYTARFERQTDLQAISRGYASGLIEYRKWLYEHIPTASVEEKKRDYFSPEEIYAITEALKKRPELFMYWMKNVPMNLADIENSSLQKQRP